MLRMVDKEYIRKMYFVKGETISGISKKLGHSRVTIRKMLKDSEIPRYTLRKTKPSPVMDPYKEVIENWLEKDEESPKKQHHTAKRIYTRLVEEYGFTGAESTVRRYVRKLKNKPKECFILLDAEPGEQAQVDFGHAIVILNKEKVKVSLFCMKLKYSQVPFVMAFPTEKEEAFLQGHVQAFEYFGGVPQEGLYDNASTQIVKILSGPERKEHQAFSSLRSHYLFDSHFHRPRKGNEKGSVEGLVRYVRRNALVPIKEYKDFNELNKHLRNWCEKEKDRHKDKWDKEKDALMELPKRPFCSATLVPVKVNTYSLVTVDRNRYSVPAKSVGKTLLAKKYVDRIEIIENESIIAIHKRSYKRDETHLKIEHYLPVFEMKPHAVTHARVVREVPPVFQQLRKTLKKKGIHWYKEYVKIIMLLKSHTLKEIEETLKKIRNPTYEKIIELLPNQWTDTKEVITQRKDIYKYDTLLKKVG
jgi:transposase